MKILSWILSLFSSNPKDNDQHTRELFNKVNIADEEYREYLKVQLNRTLYKKNEVSFVRAAYFADQLKELLDIPKESKILCVGCRDTNEINEFKKAGFPNVVGIDLYSEISSILIMDMHKMEFGDNMFDVIVSSHSLEHSYDAEKVIKEILRVAKKHALIMIEVPVNFVPRGADKIDFGGLEGLYEAFRKYAEIKQVYVDDKIRKGEGDNLSGTDIIRTIFEIEKQ